MIAHVIAEFSTAVGNDPPLSLRLQATQSSSFQGLTEAQTGSYKDHGYLILPNILRDEEATMLMMEAHGVMKIIAKGGQGIIQHDPSEKSERPSPIGRVLATFEKGQ